MTRLKRPHSDAYEYGDSNADREGYGECSQSSNEADPKPIGLDTSNDVEKHIHSLISDDEIRALMFESLDEAEVFYRQYASMKGFGVRRSNERKVRGTNDVCMKLFVCEKEGKRSEQWNDMVERRREPKRISRTGCKARIRFLRRDGVWVVSVFESEHNHELVLENQRKFVRSQRVVRDAEMEEALALRVCGVGPAQIMKHFSHQSGGVSNVNFTHKDLRNRLNQRIKRPAAGGEVNVALTYFSIKKDADVGFFYEYMVDGDGALVNMFWADSRSQIDYSCFGDVLTFDTTYKKNCLDLPLTVFIGANHHHSIIIFGFAFVRFETIEAYTWVLNTFLKAIHGKMPHSVVTDADLAMAEAIRNVFPGVRHRLCCWHLEQNAKKYVHADGFLRDLNRCIYGWWTTKRFEQEWQNLLDKYNLHENSWMVTTYTSKRMWAQAYLTGHFFGTFKTTARCEGINSVIKKNAYRYGMPLYEFVRLLGTMVDSIRDKEYENDYTSNHTKPFVRHPMVNIERHAGEIYTKASFLKVRKELEKESLYFHTSINHQGEHISIYKLMRYRGINDEVTVVYDSRVQTLSCSCKRFETIGLPCRHQFCVVKMTHMSKIPDSCIMRRWTRNAREDADDWVDASVDPNTMRNAQYASFISHCTRLFYDARKIKDGLAFAKSEIIKISSRLREMVSLGHRPMSTAGNVDDPQPLKQKRRVGKDKNTALKTTRRCSVCKKEGHNNRTCPSVELSLGKISSRDKTNMDVDIDTSDAERDETSGDDNIGVVGDNSSRENHLFNPISGMPAAWWMNEADCSQSCKPLM